MQRKKVITRFVAALVPLLAIVAAQPGGSMIARASTADGPTTISAPTSVPSSVTIRWHGTAPVLPANQAVRCLGSVPHDEYQFNLLGVADPYYNTRIATLRIRIDWTPANATVNDLNMSSWYQDSAGNLTQIQDGNKSGQNFQDVTYADPSAAANPTAIHVGVCGQNNVTPQNYTAFATLTVVAVPRVDNVTKGPQQLLGYDSPIESNDAAGRPNAGEPNIGANLETGKVMYMAGNQVSQITFNDRVTPPTASWLDVTPTQEPANEDQIIITDRVTGRTWAAGLLVAGSNIQYSDTDGSAGSWQQGTFPVPHSPDHETLGSGPYPPGIAHGSYARTLYYCSQNIVQAAGAFCGVSTDGGTSYNPSVKIFGTGTPCGSIHGHVRVAPDGSATVPQKQCSTKTGAGGEGFALSQDLGQTWTYPVPPDSTSPGSAGSDPTIMAGARDTLYFGYSNGLRHPMVTVSPDHGQTWSKSSDVGAAFGIQEAEFPEIVTGDDGRAAMAFIGTTTRGDDQAPDQSCTEVNSALTCSANAQFFKGAWDLYVAYTYDRGASWQTVKVPGGPVQRGCVWLQGGSQPCRNGLDFNEITVDKQGRVLVSYTDGCTKACKTNPNAIDSSGCGTSETAQIDSQPTCTFARQTAVARQTCGLGLFAAYDAAQTGGCFTQATDNFNPNPVAAAGGGGTPNTSGAMKMPVGSLPLWAWAALPLTPMVVFGASLARRRRRHP
ncbi:MAG: hypothetical protein ACR2MY_09005 [Candidatus Dormibacteria bacterium]